MWTRSPSGKSSASLAWVFFVLCAASARAQSPAAGLESEIKEIRAENRAIQEQLKTLLNVVHELQRRLDGQPVAVASPSPSPVDPVPQSPSPLAAGPTPVTAPQPVAAPKNQPDFPYEDGIVLVKTRDDARFPILLKLWDVTQIRYTNTQLGNSEFVDHLGATRPVVRRNDFSLNRNLIQFVGHIFDKRLIFNLIGWASNTSAAYVEGGFVGWRFGKALTLYSGYWGAPGSRTLTGSFPFFVQAERSMADQFFRPGFTQGTWIDGELPKGLHYELFTGNGLNTLTVPTSKIDPHLLFSGSAWWEPLGVYGIPGTRARSMYDDYEWNHKPVIRLGISYTKSRENRFSNLEVGNPENVALFNSDGVNTFATGAFAPGVTVNNATYRMLATDGGIKWRGFAANGQYFFRWLNRLSADAPLPIGETYDHGFEMVLSQFVVPKRWEVYGRSSFVFGQFRNSYEYAPGVKWYVLPHNHRVWLGAEGLRIVKSPLSSIITPYNAGFTGWAPTLQLMFNF